MTDDSKPARALLPANPCPLCGGSVTSPAFRKKSFSYWRCRQCGHVFTFPLPSQAQEKDYYDRAYSTKHFEQERRWFEVLANRRMEVIESSQPRSAGRRLLDVGCGYGLFLDEARRRGWTTVGIEGAEASARVAGEALGLDVRIGDIRSLLRKEEANSLDVITFWHVLEHLREPGAVLQTAIEKLRPHGRLVVNCPNLDSAIFKMVGRGWSWIYTPGHIQYFSLGGARSYLEGLGMRTLRAETWTDSPNLFFLLEETLLLWLSDAIGLLTRLTWRAHQYETRLRTYVYSADHQRRVQMTLKAAYDRFPRLDSYLKEKNLGHEFLLVSSKD